MSKSPFSEPPIVRKCDSAEPAKEAKLANKAPRPILRDEAFHGVIGRIVRRIEPHSEADPVAILVQLLAACGNAIGGGPFLAVEASRHKCNEFICIVGESSYARKGTSLDYAIKIAAAADEDWCSKCVATGLSSGEGVIHTVRDESFDKDGERVPGVDDKRLLVIETEFGSTLASVARQGNTLSAVLRNAWDGAKLRTLTKNNAETATGAHISIIAHITREELKEKLQGSDVWNGFSNRFLWVLAHRSKFLPRGGSIRIPDDVAPEIEEIRAAVAKANKRGEISRSEEAWNYWESIYRSFDDERGGPIVAVTSRSSAHVLRLALLFALLDESEQIEAIHFRAAMALWEYSLASAESIFGGMSKDASRILGALQEAGQKELSRVEIQRAVFKNHCDAGRLDKALAELLKAGAATSRKKQTEGAPRELWRAA